MHWSIPIYAMFLLRFIYKVPFIIQTLFSKLTCIADYINIYFL